MARAASATDTESEVEKRPSKSVKKMDVDTEPQGKDEGSQGSRGEDGEPEYEIEAILDAKVGAFIPGKMGYLVKWKGFGQEDNSWVDERDAGNAKDLIDEYWRTAKKKAKAPRKSEPKPKAAPSRKSATRDETSEAEETSTKKRGRGRPKVKVDTDDEDDEESARGKKKSRKSNGSAVVKKAASPPSEEEGAPPDVIRPSTMKKYKDLTSWEHLVSQVDTVEKSEDGKLLVYFKLKKDNTACREPSEICANKFPQTLIQFYETNLRWKQTDDVEEAD